MKALLSFRITVDHDDSGSKATTPIYAHIKLFREEGSYVWRIGGENGDECEGMPRPSSIKEAKEYAVASYRDNQNPKTWDFRANWNI